MPNVVEHIMAKNNVLRLDPFEITGIESVAKCMHICWENTLTIGSLDVGNKWKDSKTSVKAKFWVSNGSKYKEIVLEMETDNLLTNVSQDPSMNRFFCNANVSQLGRYVDAYILHVLHYMLPQMTKPYLSLKTETILIHRY